MKVIFWVSLTIIIYVYVGYPLVLAIVTAWRSRPTKRDETFLPTVSLVMAAYNEEKVLREKLENSLALDYPKDRLEIVVASDGSTDSTNAIAKAYANQGVTLYEVTPRGGKMRALNLTIPKTQNEILVLSDANTMYRPDAIRKLVRHFADPTVGAVTGDVRLIDAADSHSHSEGLYYRYEHWLQSQESRLGSIIGVDGAMYAVARHLFRPPSDSIILDDFVISMTVARLGYRVLYDPEAVATEQGTLSSREEFRRKVRIISGGVQALKKGEGLPDWNQPFLMFCYVSHKLLRWVLPCFLLLVLLSSIILAQEPIYLLALLAQTFFYAIAVGYGANILGLRRVRGSGIPYYFCLVNGAALVGLWKGLWGTQKVTWQRTTR
jgi:cellulose synthase/poly-beta-1,6-N-acetylglucosamine synthase-like glycosyltransferase